jgi:hypothetical protein
MSIASFKQTPPSHLFAPFFNILAFLGPVFFFGRFAIRVSQTANDVSASVWLTAFLYALFLGIVLLITANYFCELSLDESGVNVTFLWYILHVDWQDIVDIKPKRFLGRSHSWVVLTNKLSPFHRLYGAIYGFSWLPSFMISPSLHDGEKLAKIIEERVKGDSQKSKSA